MSAHDDPEFFLGGRDPLTGLPDQVFFTEQLRRLLDQLPPNHRLGICLLGLDRFATVNEGLGPVVGDRLLVAVAERLAKFAAIHGHRLARLDGDRFALWFSGTTGPEQAARAAAAVVALLAAPFDVDGHRLPVPASAGVVEREAAGADVTELLRAADIALQWARDDGRGRFALYEPARRAGDVARLRLTAEMPGALARGEFFLQYQPLVNLSDRRLVGFEALARWNHPERGELPPSQFIDLPDDPELAVSLGTHLLRLACAEAATWPGRTNRPPFVSVNLAAAQLRDPRLVPTVMSALSESGLMPSALRLEITEYAIIDTSQEALAPLRDLTDLGVGIVLDDFGTGYANLASLPLLPLKGLKLDRSFVSRLDAHSAANTKAFLRAVVSLGRSINLSVTAEGIENERQERIMRELGCDVGQGWHFGRAVADVSTLLPGAANRMQVEVTPPVRGHARRARWGLANAAA